MGGDCFGVRFRKSIKLGKNTRVNLSKSGVGISSGVKGARVSVGTKGYRTTLSAPGTGISYTSYSSHGKSNNKGNSSKGTQDMERSHKTTLFKKGDYYSKPLMVLMFSATILLLAITLITGDAKLMSIGFIICNLFLFKKYKTDTNKAYKFYNKALKLKDNEEKLKLLEMAKEIDNDNTLVNYHLAHISFENGYNEKALEYIVDMKDCKGVDPHELARIYVIALFETENYQEVINFLEKNMDIDTDLPSKLTVALAYKGLGQVKKASEILATGPVNKRTYDDMVLTYKYELGRCYLDLGDKDKAKRQLHKVYEVDSSFQDIVKYAIELGFALGEHSNE